MIYTVTFNPALDYILSLEKLEPGEVNRTCAEQLLPGGKGINVSVVLKHLGYENTALGFIAGFTGEEIIRRLGREGIRTEFIEIPGGYSRINVKIKAGQETEINGAGPDIGEKELGLLLRRLESLEDGDILVLAGSIPASVPDTVYETIMNALQEKRVRIVVDATGDLLRRVLVYRPFLIKPNKRELEELAGRSLMTREDIAEAAAQLKKQGARNVLVSLAGEGAILLDEEGRLYDRRAPEGRVLNSVGAGDSMVAGFLAGYLETGEYEKALCMGMCAGSASAFSRYLAGREDVEKLMEGML